MRFLYSTLVSSALVCCHANALLAQDAVAPEAPPLTTEPTSTDAVPDAPIAVEASTPPAAVEAEGEVIDLEPESLGADPSVTPDDVPVGTASGIVDSLRIGRQGLRFAMNLFGGVGYSAGNHTEDAQLAEVQVASHQFFAFNSVLLATATLERDYIALFEVNFEYTADGPIVDPERLQVLWRQGPHFVALGRSHTRYGWWNNAYHHGAALQPTIDRPRALRWEDDGGILPLHASGLTAGTGIVEEDFTFQVTAGVSNGRGANVDDLLIISDSNDAKALLGSAEFSLMQGALHLGVSGSYDWIAPATHEVRMALPDTELTELILNAFVSYDGPALGVFAEAYLVRHAAGTRDWLTYSAFAIARYRVDFVAPYVSVEVMALDGRDPFFFPVRPDVTVIDPTLVTGVADALGGVRIELTDWLILKLEYRGSYFWQQRLFGHTGTLDAAFAI